VPRPPSGSDFRIRVRFLKRISIGKDGWPIRAAKRAGQGKPLVGQPLQKQRRTAKEILGKQRGLPVTRQTCPKLTAQQEFLGPSKANAFSNSLSAHSFSSCGRGMCLPARTGEQEPAQNVPPNRASSDPLMLARARSAAARHGPSFHHAAHLRLPAVPGASPERVVAPIGQPTPHRIDLMGLVRKQPVQDLRFGPLPDWPIGRALCAGPDGR
jgi:hypothetical protein